MTPLTTTHTTPPNFNGNYPLSGKLIGPAWRATWALLTEAAPHYTPSTEIVRHVTAEHPITAKTVLGLLAKARHRGLLNVTYRNIGNPTRRTALYRITP